MTDKAIQIWFGVNKQDYLQLFLDEPKKDMKAIEIINGSNLNFTSRRRHHDHGGIPRRSPPSPPRRADRLLSE